MMSDRRLLSSLEEELKIYETLSDGWDGPRSKAPTPRAIETTGKFLRKLYRERYPLPTVLLAADGEISMCWEKKKVFIEVDVGDDSTLTCYAEVGESPLILKDDIPFEKEIPKNIAYALDVLVAGVNKV